MKEPVVSPELLTVGEVARMFGVDPKTVNRWVKSGKIPAGAVIRTPGGQARFIRDQVDPFRAAS